MNLQQRYGVAAVIAIACLAFVVSLRLAEDPARASRTRAASAGADLRADAPETELAIPPTGTTSTTPRYGDEGRVQPDGGSSPFTSDEMDATSIAAMREYEATRAPVVQAIRRLDLGSLERRAAILTALEESGPSSESFTRVAPDVVASWMRALPRGVAPTYVGAPRCFKAGCETTVRFADAAAFREASAAFRAINDPGAPHGGRVQVPPAVRPDGSVEGVWIMLLPVPVL